jgi:hypothetical protein
LWTWTEALIVTLVGLPRSAAGSMCTTPASQVCWPLCVPSSAGNVPVPLFRIVWATTGSSAAWVFAMV